MRISCLLCENMSSLFLLLQLSICSAYGQGEKETNNDYLEGFLAFLVGALVDLVLLGLPYVFCQRISNFREEGHSEQTNPEEQISIEAETEEHAPGVEEGRLYEEMSNEAVASREQASSVELALDEHAAPQVHRDPEERPSPDVQHAPGVEDSRLYEEISNEVVTCTEQASSVVLANNAKTTFDVQSGPVQKPYPDVQHAPVVEDQLYEEMSNEIVASKEQASSVEPALSAQAKQIPDVLPPALQKAFNIVH